MSENEPKEYFPNVAYIKVKNIRKQIAIVSDFFFDSPSKKILIVGVTGTNGKSSVVNFLFQIFNSLGHKSGLISTINYIIGDKKFDSTHTTPDSITLNYMLKEMVKENCKFCFMEVSSHSLSQFRVYAIKYKVGVFTNISHDHLDYHKTMDEYFSEKLKLFNLNKENGSSVLMIDDKYGRTIAELNPHAKCISLETKDADYSCSIYSINNLGIKGTLAWNSKTLDFESKPIGSFNLENLILAISIAIELNISAQSIAKGIENCTNIDGRLHLVENQKNQMIFLDYAHSPDAYFRTLKALEENFSRPLKVLFGAGGGRDKSKRPKMAEVVEKYSTECYLAPDNPRFCLLYTSPSPRDS